MRTIPASLLPHDGRFGSGPAKIRNAALASLTGAGAEIMGTSHRQAPVRGLVGDIRRGLAELYELPSDHCVVLGNGGASQFWDIAVSCLVTERASFGVFGEFSGKFAAAAQAAPHLADPIVHRADPGAVALPAATDDVDVQAWAHNETSTGALAPVERRHDRALTLIDGTSAAGAVVVEPAAFDVYYFAPQKAFASDGGLWFALCSPAALERMERIAASGRWIPGSLSLSDAHANSVKNQTVNTPALATLWLMREQIDWVQSLGGLAAAEARSRENARRVYAWTDAHDLAAPFVDAEHRSPVVATIDFDTSVDAAALAAALRAHGIVDVEPYRKLGRNQLRFGLFPAVDADDVSALLTCIDWLLEHTGVGKRTELGSQSNTSTAHHRSR